MKPHLNEETDGMIMELSGLLGASVWFWLYAEVEEISGWRDAADAVVRVSDAAKAKASSSCECSGFSCP